MMRSAALLLCAAIGFPAIAQEVTQGAITIGQPWTVATPPAARVGGAYATIINRGSAADRLIGGHSPAAGRVEIHLMRHQDGQMSMQPQPNGVEIAAGSTLELQPGGYHLMLLDLVAPLRAGEVLPVTLEFEHAGSVDLSFLIRPALRQSDDVDLAHSH